MKPQIFASTLVLVARSVIAQGPHTATNTGTSASWPSPTPGDFVIPNFKFDSGEELDELRLHYETIGELKVREDGSTNAVLLMHGSDAEAEQFLSEGLAGALFNPGQVLSADEYFLVIRDAIGHGVSSSPNSTGLHAKFPKYQYSDIVRADHQLLTEHLGIGHMRLVMGVSMGGMHTWMWGEEYPDFMDALMPIACLPVEIAGHNRLWRKLLMDTLLNDPAWEGGEYNTQPVGSLLGAMSILGTMFQGQAHMQAEYPTRNATDVYEAGLLGGLLDNLDDYDVNNLLYAYNASSTYNPEPRLGSIKAPLTAWNTADDLMCPAELGILEHAVQHQMKAGVGRAVTKPTSNETFGHASYGAAELWREELADLLRRTQR